MKCNYITCIFSEQICGCNFNIRYGLRCSNKCLFTLSSRMAEVSERVRALEDIVSTINRDFDGELNRVEESLKGIKYITECGANEALKLETTGVI